jgi:hypothetical protein
MTLEILTEKYVEDQNVKEFLECALNVWCMLLTKVEGK